MSVVFSSSTLTETKSSAAAAEADLVTSALAKLLRTTSIAICLIVIASFAVFAVNQTKSASNHQQEQLATPAEAAQRAAAPVPPKHHESSVHEVLDEVSGELTSPFAGLASGSSEWANRGAELLLALLVYGFGLGYLARVLRVRV
jgi:predicted PurR-regulated permease PerM